MSEGRAFLVTRPDGRFVDASPEALELFGVDLERLRSMRVGDLTAPSQRDTVRDACRSLVTGAEEGYAGEADITRPDGTSLRVRFRTGRHPGRPGHFVSVVSSAGPPRDAVTVRTGAQVLAEWHEAERNVERQLPDTAEHREATSRVEALRAEYQEVTAGRSIGT